MIVSTVGASAPGKSALGASAATRLVFNVAASDGWNPPGWLPLSLLVIGALGGGWLLFRRVGLRFRVERRGARGRR